jgi:hypothetical protein
VQFLSKEQSRDWAVSHGLNPKWGRYTRHLKVPPFVVARVDLELGTFLALPLARDIAKWLPQCGRLLWITAWGVWPSSEDQNLFRRLRASYGETRYLIETPGHLFATTEMEDLTTYLSLAIGFGWDAVLLTTQMEFPTTFVSHDEYMTFEGKDIPDEIIQHFQQHGKLTGLETIS